MSADASQSSLPQPPLQAAFSPRQLIDSLCEMLRRNDVVPKAVEEALGKLEEAVHGRFSDEDASAVYEEAVNRAPWLTATACRLKEDRLRLRQSLQALGVMARRGATSADWQPLLCRQFDDFVEQYLDHEATAENLLHDAYPGPDWISR